MGKLRPGKKINRKNVIRIAEGNLQRVRDAEKVTENAILYNAALHRSLQHELCVCTHGASKHLWAEDHDSHPQGCKVVDCECNGYKSNHDQSLENWKVMVFAELEQKHHLVFVVQESELTPMSPDQLLKSFEMGRTPEEHALGMVKWLQVREENKAEKAEPPQEVQP